MFCRFVIGALVCFAFSHSEASAEVKESCGEVTVESFLFHIKNGRIQSRTKRALTGEITPGEFDWLKKWVDCSYVWQPSPNLSPTQIDKIVEIAKRAHEARAFYDSNLFKYQDQLSPYTLRRIDHRADETIDRDRPVFNGGEYEELSKWLEIVTKINLPDGPYKNQIQKRISKVKKALAIFNAASNTPSPSSSNCDVIQYKHNAIWCLTNPGAPSEGFDKLLNGACKKTESDVRNGYRDCQLDNKKLKYKDGAKHADSCDPASQIEYVREIIHDRLGGVDVACAGIPGSDTGIWYPNTSLLVCQTGSGTCNANGLPKGSSCKCVYVGGNIETGTVMLQ